MSNLTGIFVTVLGGTMPEELCAAWGCGKPWARQVSETIPLCMWHFAESHAAYANFGDRVDRRMTEEGIGPERRMTSVWRQPTGGPVVYYVAMNEHIKIGTTSRFPARMKALYVQPEDVLAIEPGGRPLETSRHQQFEPYRVRGTELFQRNRILDELIADLAERYLYPWTAAVAINYPKGHDEEISEADLAAEQSRTVDVVH